MTARIISRLDHHPLSPREVERMNGGPHGYSGDIVSHRALSLVTPGQLWQREAERSTTICGALGETMGGYATYECKRIPNHRGRHDWDDGPRTSRPKRMPVIRFGKVIGHVEQHGHHWHGYDLTNQWLDRDPDRRAVEASVVFAHLGRVEHETIE